jgi:Cu/Ag efflux protein CusF
MNVRTPTSAGLILAGLVASTPLVAQTQQPAATTNAVVATAPGAAVAAQVVKTTATVVGIDAATRVVTLKRQDGKVMNITAGEEVRNFAQIKVGDKVTAEYVQALTLELKKSGSSIRESSQQDAAARAPAGAKPAGAVARQTTILANVVDVDAKKKTITLRGPAGNMVDLSVQDPAQLKSVKKGDQVEAVYTEALAVKVEAAAAAK